MRNKIVKLYLHFLKTIRKIFISLILKRKYFIFFGSNHTEKKFYLIRRFNAASGIFSNFTVFLKHIRFATENGLIPVIDMQYEENCLYHEPCEVGRVNVWEYYFDQPCGYSIKDVFFSAKVLLSDSDVLDLYQINHDIYKNKDDIDYWGSLAKKYLKFNHKTEIELNDIFNKVIPNDKKILGVSVRDGYIKGEPSGHPIQPSLEELIYDTSKFFVELGYDYIFLSVENQSVVDRFQLVFGNKLICLNRPRINSSHSISSNRSALQDAYYRESIKECIDSEKLTNLNSFLETVTFDRKDDKYLKGLEYISEMYILSRCHSLICGITSGTISAIILNQNCYEFLKAYDLGVYK